MDDNPQYPIKKFIMWLRILVTIAIAMSCVEIIVLFFSDEKIALNVGDDIWTQSISTFGLPDRSVLFGAMSIQTLFWCSVLYQFWCLCDLYEHNKIFTSDNARHFKYISWGLIGMAIVETLILPFIGYYLKSRGFIPQMPDIDALFLLEIDILTAGIFFWLISKIMERAALLQEEVGLTV